jgi:hypothetical protein
MANTTNFGWETPDDTDLVKDGAAAIRTLGQAIDTSLMDLEGGTTDQVLAKNSNADMDFKWVTSDDANAIQNAIVDAKGDIIAASANDTPARLAVGTNDQRLVAASGEATGLKYVSDTQNTVIDAAGDLLYGTAADTLDRLAIGTAGQVLKVNAGATAPEWGAAAGGATYVGATVYADNVFQAVSDSTLTAILFPSEDWDTDGFHSTSSNTSRITIPTGKGGKYQITAAAFLSAAITGQMNLRIYKNGSAITGTGLQNGMFAFQYANSDKISGTVTVDAVATDYFEIFIIHTAAGGSKDVRYARFSADYLGA